MENSLGILKEEFPVLNHMRVKNKSRVSSIVTCCITLHNMQNKYCHGTYDGIYGEIANRQPNNDDQNEVQQNEIHQVQNVQGIQRQLEFIEYFNA